MDQLQNEKIEALLTEFTTQRSELTNMVKELEVIRKKVDILFPKEIDARYVRFFEEKVKAATELFKAILDIRKEMLKSIKDEIEIRKKIDSKTLDIEDFLTNRIDLRGIVKKIEKFKDLDQKTKDDSEVLLDDKKGE